MFSFKMQSPKRGMTSKAFLFALFTSVFVQLIGVDNGHD